MAEDEGTLWIEGKGYTASDLTFREQRAWSGLLDELSPPIPCKACKEEGTLTIEADDSREVRICPLCAGEGKSYDRSANDFAITMLTLLKRRDNPEFSLEDALDYKPSDIAAPPTRPAKKKAAAKQ
jgi:hypothetical protein